MEFIYNFIESINSTRNLIMYSSILLVCFFVMLAFIYIWGMFFDKVFDLFHRIVVKIKLVIEEQKREELPYYVKNALGFREYAEYLNMPPWLKKWSDTVGPNLISANIKNINPVQYIVAVIILMVIGFSLGSLWLKNISAAVALGVMMYIIPDMIIIGRAQRRSNKILEQLPIAISILSSEIKDSVNVQAAFQKMARQISDPLGIILKDTARGLSLSSDPQKVIADMRRKLNSSYGNMFSQLLLLSLYDSSIQNAFTSLAAKVYTQRDLMLENNRKISSSRYMSLLFMVLIGVTFMVLRQFSWGYSFFYQSFYGKLTITMFVASIILWNIMERILSRVE